MSLSLRALRLRAVWFLVLPFFFFARPTGRLLLVGFTVALVGLGVRAWAAGTIHKNAELSTGGPYAFTRNPLYLGSLLLGIGATIAGGQWIFVALFLAFFGLVYRPTMQDEARFLEDRFGDAYRRYASSVPVILPRLTPYRASGGAGTPFRVARYIDNREWEAALGLLGAVAVLVAKAWWSGSL